MSSDYEKRHLPTPLESEYQDKSIDTQFEKAQILASNAGTGAELAAEQIPLKSQLDRLSVWQGVKAYRKASAIAMLAAFSAMMDGYQINLNGSIVSNAGFIQQMYPGHTIMNPSYVSAWGGIQSAGQFFGQFGLQYATDWLGRKKALYILWVVLVASVLAETLANEWWVWLIAKLLAGMGVGMLQATMPLYITELAPNQLRGFLVNAYSFWFVVGQLIAPVVLRQLFVNDPLIWKIAIYTQWPFIGAMIAIFLYLPESPWWLSSKGRLDDAARVLQRINGNVQGYDIDRELAIITGTIEAERKQAASNRVGTFDVFKGINGWRLLIACWPKVLQQFVGLTVFNSYSAYFFQLAGNKDPFQVTMILACVQLISIVMVCSLSDGIGRRGFTVYGYLTTVVAVLCLGIVGCFDYTSAALGSLLIFFACVAIFSTTGASAIGYAYLTEIPSQKYRARTAGWGLAIQSLFGTMFSFVVPILLKGAPNWGIKTGFFFAGTGVPGVILAWFILPETAKRSAAEIDEMFAKRVPSRRFKSYVTQVQIASDQAAGQVQREE